MTLNALINWSKKGNKISIFCAGQIGIATYVILKRCGVKADCFFDNDKKKHGREIVDGCICQNADLVKNKERYVIFIGISDNYYHEVEEDIKNKGFINIVNLIDVFDDVIENYPFLYKEMVTWFQNYPSLQVFYIRNPNKNSEALKYDVLKKKKIAVYTGIFGQYDSICCPKVKPQNIDYYFISDDECKIEGFIWIDAKKIIPENVTSSIKRNRYIKMHPHILFPDYEYSIYVDGNVEIKKDISSFARESSTGISVFMHPSRDCIFYEAIAIVNFRRVSAIDVNKQMERYIKEGMPLHYGLPEMSVIAREHNKPICKKIMNEWWNEFEHGAQRDQLSFMYVMWKNNMGIKDISSLGNDFRKSECLEVREHQIISYKVKNEII